MDPKEMKTRISLDGYSHVGVEILFTVIHVAL
jgi:hypothetical protein